MAGAIVTYDPGTTAKCEIVVPLVLVQFLKTSFKNLLISLLLEERVERSRRMKLLNVIV